MGAAVLIAFLGMLGGFGAALALMAYTRLGVVVLGGKFLAELTVLLLGLCVVLWGLPLAAAAFGIAR